MEALPGIQAARVAWGSAVAGSARDLLTDPNEDDGEGKSAASSAEDFLRELLADGPMPSRQVKADALEAGHAWRTVRRAADDLAIVRKKGGMDSGWYWRMPEGVQRTSKVSIENVGHLREKLDTFEEFQSGGSGSGTR